MKNKLGHKIRDTKSLPLDTITLKNKSTRRNVLDIFSWRKKKIHV